jgi:CBS-domain-containing membrane protein
MLLMAQRQVRRMPVVDTQGRVTGIIAQADVATRMHKDTETGQMVESISEPPLQR